MSAPASEPQEIKAPVRDERGYYHMPNGRKLLSVTTILSDGIPKPALVHWAAWEVATCAMTWLPRLARVRGDDARKTATAWLQKAAERRRDAGANLGGAIHDACEARILGTAWPEPTDEQRPFLEAFARFCDRWRPRWEATEMVLANYTHGWAGRGDAWLGLTLPDAGPEPVAVLADWKTGKGYYPEAALQMSAYARAEVGFLRDGTQVIPPVVTHALIVHLRPDRYPKTGGYRVIPVDIGDTTYAAFRHAQATAEGWVRGRAAHAIGKPYPEPPSSLREAS